MRVSSGKNRLLASLIAALLVPSAAAAPGPGTPPGRSSLLLVTLDTTRADHIGVYGATSGASPNLDALARAGTRFDRAMSPTPLTVPSHATMMTGLVPRRHGVRDNAGYRLAGDVPVVAERFRDAGYRTLAFVSAAVLDRGLGLARGFATYDDTVRVGERSAFDHQERAARQTVDAALGALTDASGPLFVWVHLFDPHLPYVPPEPFRTRFASSPYDGEIAFMDAQIGRLVDAVRRRTGPALVVAIAGDHGESLGEHGEAAHGVFLYQATQHVPLILTGPGIPAGRNIPAAVGLVDLAPTLLDLLRIPPLPRVDGRSLAPLLRGGPSADRDYEMETFFPAFSYGWSPLRALVSGGLKYVDAPRPELYDLATDASETVNVLVARRDAARGMAARLDALVGTDPLGRPSDDPEIAEQRRRIEALGYVGGTGASDEDASTTPIDPKDGIEWLADLDAARRALQFGSPESGLEAAERLVRRNPNNVPATLVLGQCRLGTGDAAGAERAFRRAVEINPKNALAHFNLANALSVSARAGNAGAKESARASYERALALDPRSADTYLNFAAFLGAQRDLAGAERILSRAREAGVRDPSIAAEAGLLALARGDETSARASLEEAIALNPRDARSLETLGRIAYGNERYAEAASYYEKALDAAPSPALAKTLGSIRLYGQGDRDGARRAYARAIALSRPDDPDLAELRALVDELADR